MAGGKVNLFVVGAMKAGTTSFMDRLSGHPDIYVSPIKEPHYFINELPKNLYEPSRFFSLDGYLVNDFPEPLHICKVEKPEQYQKVFSLAEAQKYRAEGSTAYLHAPESPQLIHDYNPKAKLVLLVRDPLKRAFSHYQMDMGKGREMRSFEKVMQEQIELYNTGGLPWNSYLAMSFYNEPIARYKKLFGEFLLLKFEEWVAAPEEAMKRVSEFLEITPFTSTQDTHKNVSRTLRFQKLFYFLKQMGLKDYFSKVFGTKFKQWIFRKVSSDKKSDMKLSADTAAKLEVIFTKESGECYY